MADSVPDLWGDGIDVNDLSPVIILNTQAAIIQRRTKGIINAEVIKRSANSVTELVFDIKSQVARHRSRLLSCRYIGEEVYPVWVTSEPLESLSLDKVEKVPSLLNLDAESLPMTLAAWGQDDFLKIVSIVFKSSKVKARISSMLAIGNEAKQPLDHLVEEGILATVKSS